MTACHSPESTSELASKGKKDTTVWDHAARLGWLELRGNEPGRLFVEINKGGRIDPGKLSGESLRKLTVTFQKPMGHASQNRRPEATRRVDRTSKSIGTYLTNRSMKLLVELFYIVLFVALIFFGPLQEYVYKKKSEWDLKKSRELKVKTNNEPSTPADPERMGLRLSIVLIILALAFLIWKILTTIFTST